MILTEIVAAVGRKLAWSPKTIQTLLGRLVKKGAVGSRPKQGRRNEYFPLLKENAYKRRETKSFVSRVYNGQASLLVSSMVEQEMLDDEEVERLLRLLKGAKKS